MPMMATFRRPHNGVRSDYVGGGGDVAGHAEAVGAWGTAASLLMLVNTGT